MAVTYNWVIEQMDAYPEKDGNTNVVFTVHWRVNANDGNYISTSYGTVGISTNPDIVFTPYNNLKKTQVVRWVKDALGNEEVTNIERSLAGQIENLKNPPSVSLSIPWN